MDVRRICTFRNCNMVVAPGDPARLVYKDKWAHEPCLRRTGIVESTAAEAKIVIARLGNLEIAANFARGLDRARRPADVARLISWNLSLAYTSATNGRSGNRAAIVAFAEKAADALLCPIDVGEVKPVRRAPAPASASVA